MTQPSPVAQRVPGKVTVVTSGPVEMPLSARDGQSSAAERIEERPWLVAVALLAVLGAFLVARRRA